MTRTTHRLVVVALSSTLIVSPVIADPLNSPGKARVLPPGENLTQPLVGVRSAGRALSKPDRKIPAAPLASSVTKSKRARAGKAEDGAQQASTGAKVKLSGGGRVGLIGTSFDGSTAFWTEDVGGLGIFEAFQRPIDGSSPAIPLTPGLLIAPGVTEAAGTPDDSAVVYIADIGSGPEVFSVSVGGGPSVPLSGAGVSPFSLGITPDSSTVFFFGSDTVSFGPATELHVATIGAALSSTQISSANGTHLATSGVVFVTPTDDSSTLIYAMDPFGGALDFFTDSVAGASETQETFTFNGVSFIRTASDSSTFYVIGDPITPTVRDIFQHTAGAGGPNATINTPMAGAGAEWLELSNDDSVLAYTADRDLAGVTQAFAVSTSGPLPDAGVLLSTPGASTANGFINLNTGGTHAVWESEELGLGEVELFGRATDGSTPQVLLHDIVDGSGDTLGFFVNNGYPIATQRAYYPRFVAGAPPIVLHSVRADGTEPFKTVNSPFTPGDSAWGAYLPADGQRLTAYITGPIAAGGSAIDRVMVGPLRADLPVEQANRTADLAGGELGVFDYFLPETNDHVLYTQDGPATIGIPELYSHALDSDGDGVPNTTDNCRYVPNGGQGLVPFPVSPVLATDRDTFGWGAGTYLDVAYAKGLFPLTAAYTTTETGALFDADRYVEDGPDPAPGTGCWYVFSIDCPAGDWGNGGRNAILP